MTTAIHRAQQEIARSPAFPRSASHWDSRFDEGMNLREYYAGQALAGIMGNSHFFGALMQQSAAAAAEFASAAADMLVLELARTAIQGEVK